jgi:uncharacterized protein YndB with AHSA1/START domain
MDHFTHGWRVTREDTYGKGAGARYAVRQRFNRYPFIDYTVIEFEPPRRLVLAGRAGKFNRIRALTEIELDPAGGEGTRVSVSYETQRKIFSDRFFDHPGFYRRGWKKALRRLRDILEEDRGRGVRATIAGGARKPATGFRFQQPDPIAKK